MIGHLSSLFFSHKGWSKCLQQLIVQITVGNDNTKHSICTIFQILAVNKLGSLFLNRGSENFLRKQCLGYNSTM